MPLKTQEKSQGLKVSLKKRNRSILGTTEIPDQIPGPQYSIPKLVAREMRKFRTEPLKVLKKTRLFVHAKLNGAPTQEAKQLAGFSKTTPTTHIMSSPIAQSVLDEILKEPEFQNEGVTKRLKQMWNHKKIKMVKVAPGSQTMEKEVAVEEDDTDLWKYSMDTVLELRGYKKHAKEMDLSGASLEASTINFNVLNIPSEKAA